MKKLLFTLVATAACGAVSAAVEDFSQYTLGAEFSAATNTAGEVSGTNPGNWTINMSTGPEMLITNNVADTTTGTGNYLQINTGNTPLWRTFANVTSVDDATSGVPQATTIEDGTVVSSKVKLTACTEWPELESFWGEKLALFLYAPEDEAAAASHSGGLYAVGGTWITVDDQPVFTNKAYKLAVTGDITNNFGWAKIDIKAYTNVLSVASSYSGFIVAVNGNLVTVETDETDYIGLGEQRTLSNAAKARFDAKELILAAATGQFAGLGFQGEGGIDDVDLAADAVDGMADAATMTVKITDGVGYSGITLGDNDAYSFTSTNAVTFTLNEQAVAGKIVTVNYANAGEAKATYDTDARTVTFTPVKGATLTITVRDAKFEIGGVKYGSLEDALAALANGGTLKLLGALELGANLLTFDQVDTESGEAIDFVLDLNGQTISGSGTSDANAVIVVAGANLTIMDSVGGGKILPLTAGGYAVYNTAGALEIQAGAYDGAVVTEAEATTTITDGKFKVTEGIAVPTGKKWSAADKDGYYTLVDNVVEPADPVPSIPENDVSGTTITQNGDDYVVTPGAGVTEVTVNTNGFAGKIEIPVSVEKIIGVAAGQLKLMVEVRGEGDTVTKIDIAKAIKIKDDGTISLKDKDEYVDGVKIEPELATTAEDGETEIAPFVAGDEPAANVRTIPGLKYKLVYSDDLATDRAFIGTADEKVATGSRTELVDKNKSATKRFYRVKVSIK